MPDYKEKNLQRQKTINTTTQTQKALQSTKKYQPDKTNVYGKSGLSSPIPKEAKDKSVTDSIKSFFRIGADKSLDKVSAPDNEDDNINAKPKHVAAVDLTDAERVSESDTENIAVWKSYEELADNIMSSAEYKTYPDKVKKIVEKLKNISLPTTGEEDRFRMENEIKEEIRTELGPRRTALEQDSETLNDITDEKQREARLKELDEKYRDVQVMTMISTVLFANLKGELELKDNVPVITREDNWFCSSRKVTKSVMDKAGNKYTKEETYFPKKQDYSDYPLFSGEPCMEDVRQGNFGDCYLISSLAAIVDKNPDFIKSSMKDEGSTVVVRFFSTKNGKPVYVRVNKSVAAKRYVGEKDGQPIYAGEKALSAKGALWVKIIEKAFAVFMCDQRDNGSKTKKAVHADVPDWFGVLSSGSQDEFIRMFTGKKVKVKSLTGNALDLMYRKTKDISALFSTVRNNKTKNPMFNDDKIFDAYEGYLRQCLNKDFAAYFKSNFGFASMLDVDTFLSSVDISKMPHIEGLGEDVDEMELRKKYIEYFRKSVLESGLLKNPVNTTGEYNSKEKEVYKDIKTAIEKRKIVTASVKGHILYKKEGAGAHGEQLALGVASGHAYSVHGVTEKQVTIGGKTITQRYVILTNPWRSHSVRLYDKDTFIPYEADKEKEDGSEYKAKGEFLMELSDFYYTFGDLTIEK